MEINKYNFLRWDPDKSVLDPEALPNAYIMERCRPDYMPILVPGEKISFYINTDVGLDYATPSDLRMRIVDQQGTSVYANLNILHLDNIDVTHNNIYVTEYTIPALANGVYFFQIMRSSTILLESNALQAMNAGYKDISSLLRFRNDRNLYNVRYSGLPNFYQQFRLSITEVDFQYENNRKQYTSVTDGEIRNLISIPQKYHVFESYYFDKKAHEAAACMVEHMSIYVNDKPYTFKTGYKLTPVVLAKTTKGSFELYDQNFASINRC